MDEFFGSHEGFNFRTALASLSNNPSVPDSAIRPSIAKPYSTQVHVTISNPATTLPTGSDLVPRPHLSTTQSTLPFSAMILATARAASTKFPSFLTPPSTTFPIPHSALTGEPELAELGNTCRQEPRSLPTPPPIGTLFGKPLLASTGRSFQASISISATNAFPPPILTSMASVPVNLFSTTPPNSVSSGASSRGLTLPPSLCLYLPSYCGLPYKQLCE